MKKEEIEHFYRTGHTCRGAVWLRFFLMLFVCFQCFGFPEPTGAVKALSGFAAPAFYILSGFFVLSTDEERRKGKTVRKLKKTFLWFAALFVIYGLINAAVFIMNNISLKLSLRAAFNFFALDQWFLPIGRNIRFIHAMLYAYIVIFIAEKLKLMKFYKPVMVITFIIMLFTGEFAGVIRFNVLGYGCFPACWLTSALPYILLGMFMREKRGSLVKLRTWVCAVMFVFGGLLVIGEIILLGRSGMLISDEHFVGFGLMAFAVCCWAVTHPEIKRTRLIPQETAFTGLVYAMTEPLYYVIGFTFGKVFLNLVTAFGGIAALFLSIMFSLCIIKTPLYQGIRKRHREKVIAAGHLAKEHEQEQKQAQAQ